MYLHVFTCFLYYYTVELLRQMSQLHLSSVNQKCLLLILKIKHSYFSDLISFHYLFLIFNETNNLF
jgi:hypothetical protein